MVQISIEYRGDLRCEATHGPSGTTLRTDAPADILGKAESFSPTDLVATALGTCILTVMGTKAAAMGVDISGSTAEIEKEMATDPRRIGKLAATIRVPHDLPERDRTILERTAWTCPVHRSLSHDVASPIEFVWAGRRLAAQTLRLV